MKIHHTREFDGAGGVRLRAWLAGPPKPPRGVVVVLHGIADSKASQLWRIRFLAGRGIVGVAPDLRAHGESGGRFATYGYHEKNDLCRMLDQLAAAYPGLPVGLWGVSYGGAVAIQSMAADRRFAFGIVESTFADLGDVVRRYADVYGGTPARWIADPALARAADMAGFRADHVRPEIAVGLVAAPVLHLHGGADPLIPLDHAYRIQAGARSTQYRFVEVEGGGHFDLRGPDPDRYDQMIVGFLERVLR